MYSIYLITGDDDARIRAEAKKRIEQLSKTSGDQFALEVHKESDDLLPQQVIDDVVISLLTPPFLTPQKLIWLQNISFLSDEGGDAALQKRIPLALAFAKLAETIGTHDSGDIMLIISGPGADPKKRLYKACKEKGNVTFLTQPNLRKKRWRQEVSQLIDAEVSEHGMQLSRESKEYLIDVVGVDTGRIKSEVEKLHCYAGSQVTFEQVREICVGNREANYFALSNAFGERNINSVFKTIAQLVDRTKESEYMIIGQIRFLAGFFNEMLQAKLLMTYLKIRSGANLTQRVKALGAQIKPELKGVSILSKPDWQVKNVAAQASRYSGPELVRAIGLLAKADKNLVSSTLSSRMILEMLAIQIVGSPRKDH